MFRGHEEILSIRLRPYALKSGNRMLTPLVTKYCLTIFCEKQRPVQALCAFNDHGKDKTRIMKSLRLGITALLSFLAIQCSTFAWAQNGGAVSGPQQAGSAQPAPVIIVSPPLTNYERVASNADQPLVHLAFPVVSVDVGPQTTLSLTPHALTPFGAPGALRALAVEFQLSRYMPARNGTELSQSHLVATVLDFDELLVFRRIFNVLAATGFPPSRFSDAKAVVRMASKSGMRLELTAEPGGRVQCVVASDIDSVTLSLDLDSARKWADAFTEAFRILDAVRDSIT